LNFQGRSNRSLCWRFLSIAAVVSLLAGSLSADAAYRASVEKWRAAYEASLKSDDGWLTVAGLFWLHEGENKFGSDPLNDIVLNEAGVPPEVGSFDMHGGKIVVRINPGVQIKLKGNAVESAAVLPDSDDRLALGDLSLLVHRSGERYAVRLKDKNSKLRRGFAGLRWFPIDESYRVTAKFVAYDTPRAAEIQNDAGDMLKIPAPGYAVFTLAGKEYRLEALDEGGAKLSFIFRDLTSGKETYASSRFLDAPLPKDGQVVLDFNEAYNPPCAYNPYTTCPLPTPENRLRVRIAAGELMYKGRRGQ
jgi:uncharacterized protein